MLGALLVAGRLSGRMKAELARGIPRDGSTRQGRLLEAPADTVRLATPGSFARATQLAAPLPLADEAAAASLGGPAIRPALGYPAPLAPLYEGLKLIPDSHWEFEIAPISVEQFDSPDGLLDASESLPLIEAPIFALLNAVAHHPDRFRVMGRSFSAGIAPRTPFVFVCGSERQDEQIDVNGLRGTAIAVLGKYMSPTVVLLRALKDKGIESAIWRTDEWMNRRVEQNRVDVLVSGTYDAQMHALKSGQVSHALVIYPYTHAPHGAWHSDSTMCRGSIGSLEDKMGQLLSMQPLNMLVTRADWYPDDPKWRNSVDDLMGSVAWKNRILDQADESPAVRQADGFVEQTLISQEVAFETDLDDLEGKVLAELTQAGTEVGLWNRKSEGDFRWVQ